MTKLVMPKIDRKLISKKAQIVVANLKKIIKAENILDHEDQIDRLKQMRYQLINKNH